MTTNRRNATIVKEKQWLVLLVAVYQHLIQRLNYLFKFCRNLITTHLFKSGVLEQSNL